MKIVKKSFWISITIIYILMLQSYTVYAQQPISLAMAIERAVQQNLMLKTTQFNIQSQQALTKSAWQIPKTGVDLMAGQVQSRPFDYTLNASQQFEPFGAYRSRSRMLSQQVNVLQKQQDIQRNELVANVKQQYYQILYQYQLLKLLQSQDTLYKRAVTAAKIRYQTGETNQIEVVATETNQRELLSRKTMIDRELQVGYLTLQSLLFSQEAISIDTTLVLQRGYAMQENINRYVALAEEEARLSKTFTDIERAQLKPDWNIGVANQSIEGRLGFVYMSGGVGIPLFAKAQKARIEAAKIGEIAADNQLKTIQFQSENNIKILRETLNKLQITLQYYEQSALPQADLLLQTAYKQLRLGDIEYIEFFQNIRQAYQIKEAYLAEQLRFSQTVIELEKWLGIE